MEKTGITITKRKDGRYVGKFIAEYADNGKALSAVLGHSSVTLTLNRYIHPDRTYERRLMNMCMKL